MKIYVYMALITFYDSWLLYETVANDFINQWGSLPIYIDNQAYAFCIFEYVMIAVISYQLMIVSVGILINWSNIDLYLKEISPSAQGLTVGQRVQGQSWHCFPASPATLWCRLFSSWLTLRDVPWNEGTLTPPTQNRYCPIVSVNLLNMLDSCLLRLYYWSTLLTNDNSENNLGHKIVLQIYCYLCACSR